MELNNAIHQYTATSKPQFQARDDSLGKQAQVPDTGSRSTGSDSVEISKEGKDAASKNSDSGKQTDKMVQKGDNENKIKRKNKRESQRK